MSTPKTFHQLAQELKDNRGIADDRYCAGMADAAEQLEALIREWEGQTVEGFLDMPAEFILGGAEKP